MFEKNAGLQESVPPDIVETTYTFDLFVMDRVFQADDCKKTNCQFEEAAYTKYTMIQNRFI